ncbi:MAG: TIGR00159 family protein [Clostridiaceae bacterium]|nr:TIGR00159 family protein [Clostridiaceae bacterium]
MSNTTGQLDEIVNFFKNIFTSLQEGILFIGEPLDVILSVIDILITTLIFYYILRIIRDSRAWQLLKGIVFIVVLTIIAKVFGLSLLSFLLLNTISIFSVAIVIIFQPELRRTLETVGRSGLGFISSKGGGYFGEKTATTTSQLIESIVQACHDMALTKTGALIVIERQTPLGDLQNQENAVQIDSPVSTSLLKQIFYNGTPLHDGAILIRNGRIAAAKIHIPLSDNYHLRKDYGTRHRAAIGASEMGDAISIVVSEEKGTISLAIDGILYVLDNSDALRTQLHSLLLPDEEEKKHFKIFRKKEKKNIVVQPTKKSRKFLLMLAALLTSVFLWLYVQITVNPITSKTFNVVLSYQNTEALKEKGLEATYSAETVQLSLTGRKNLLDGMTNRDIEAYIDFNQVEEAGIQSLNISIDKNTPLYTRTDYLTPDKVTIAVRPYNENVN